MFRQQATNAQTTKAQTTQATLYMHTACTTPVMVSAVLVIVSAVFNE